MDADSPVDATAGSLEDVSPKTPDVRAAPRPMALNLLAYVVIRFDVAAKATQVVVKLTDRCTRCTGPKYVDMLMGS